MTASLEPMVDAPIALPSSGAASKRAFVLASRSPICRRNVVVGATPRM